MSDVDLSHLIDKLEPITRIVRVLTEKAAQRFTLDCPLVVVRMQDEPIVVVGGNDPMLQFSAAWLFAVVLSDTALLAHSIEKAVIVSNKQARATLSQPNPHSYIWVAERQKFRKATKDYTLPHKYFAVSLAVTVTCPLTGRSLSASCHARDQVATTARLERELSQQLFLDEEIADILDTIEAAREASVIPPAPARITLVPYVDGFHQTLHYDESPTFAVAALYTMHAPNFQ